MPAEQIFVCVLALVMIGLFIWEKISPDIIAMGVLFLLFVVPFDGRSVLSPADSTQQRIIIGGIFGNSAILTVTFMFIVGAAVDRTGLVELLGHWFEKVAGDGGRRTLLLLGLLAIPASAFMNNTTVVIVFMPMVIGLCRRRNLMPSRYLIPLSYFAIAGGMCTMIGTSTNLVVNGVVKQKGLEPFRVFDIAPVGTVLSIGVLALLLLIGRRLLPNRPSLAVLIDSESSHEFLIAAIIAADSPLVKKKFAATPLVTMKRLRLIEVRRSGNRVETPLNELTFEAGDRIILKCHFSAGKGKSDAQALETTMKEQLGLSFVHTEKAVLMEGLIGPNSHLIGKSVVDVNFRQQYGVLIVALHRDGENQRENFQRIKLEVGDTLLLEGSKERMNELFSSGDFINLSEVPEPAAKPGTAGPARSEQRRAWVALLALALVVFFGSIDLVAFEWVALGAALLVVGGGCLKREEIYQAVDWRILVLIMGTLALGQAMDRSGAAATLVRGLMSVIGGWDRRLIVSIVLLLSIMLTELLSNNAVAALLTPLAIQLGVDMGVDPRPLVVAVMMGSSIGFAIPSGYQTHMLVYSAGGYKFRDFFQIGVLMDIACWLLGSLAINWFFPLLPVGG